MIEVIYRRRAYLVPEGWNELSPQQFLAIMRVLTGNVELVRAKMLILRALMDIKWGLFSRIRADLLMPYLALTDWVEEAAPLTTQLLPVVYAGGKLVGPKAAFDNVRAGEFHFADMHYSAWKHGEDEQALYRFLAVLYRPVKKGYDITLDPDGDIRVPFNPHTTDYYAVQLRKLSAEEVSGIVFCYESWRRQMEQDYPRIFTIGNKAKAVRYGWFPVFRGIAGSNKYGPLESVEQMYMHTLLAELELLKDEEEELKRKHPEMFK